MKKICLCLSLILLLLVCSCSKLQKSDEFIKEYYINSNSISVSSYDNVSILDSAETDSFEYSLVEFSGEGPELVLYKFKKEKTDYKIFGECNGELAASPLISINCVRDVGKYIYFGSVSDSHFNPLTDEVTKIDAKSIIFKDAENKETAVDLKGKQGFICILDSELSDFYVNDTDDKKVLDYSSFNEQGIGIQKVQMINID